MKFWKTLLLILLLSFFSVAIEPLYISRLISSILESLARNAPLKDLCYLFAHYIFAMVFGVFLDFFITLLLRNVLPVLEVDSRQILFSHVQNCSSLFNENEGEIVRKIDVLSEEIHELVSKVATEIIPAFCVFFASIGFFGLQDKLLGLCTLIWIILHFFLKYHQFAKIKSLSAQHNEYGASIAGITSDSYKNNLTFRFFSLQKSEQERLKSVQEKMKNLHQEFIFQEGFLYSLRSLVCIFFQGFCAHVIMFYLFSHGKINLHLLFRLININGSIMFLVWRTGQKLNRIFKAWGKIENAIELLKTPCDTSGTFLLQAPQIDLKLHNLSVKRNEKILFQDLSLHLPQGLKIAIIGPSGCGKSTFLNVIAGLHRQYEGEVLFNQTECGDINNRDFMSYILADQSIFNTTIEQNIAKGDLQKSLEEIKIAAGKARIFLPLETIVGSSGKSLSSGQQQRVAIARAFLRQEAQILLADEPFRCLDRKTAQEICQEILDTYKSSTILCVDHTGIFKEFADYIMEFNTSGQIKIIPTK